MSLLKRLALYAIVLIALCGVGAYYFNQYWIHRYDALIAQQAAIYHLDPDLVWSVIYEETYFSPWKTGEAGEVGLMQVTPTVGREWAAEAGTRESVGQMKSDPETMLRDPTRNIKIGCWYLEKISKDYRDTPGAEARIVAGYNAGPSRAADWNKVEPGSKSLNAEQFIARIDISSTRAYVSNILARYEEVKASGKR